jgi:dTMP kinase
VRRLVLHSSAISPAAEMYLFMAARAELLAEVVEPALAQGRVVVLDRYHDSTLAYQGGGRGLDVDWPASFRRPDRTYLLLVEPEVGRGRGKARPDRVEAEPLEFHRRVVDAYRRLAAQEPGRILALDGTLPAEEVNRRIVADVRALVAARRMVPSSS